jgi:hypothetical protein
MKVSRTIVCTKVLRCQASQLVTVTICLRFTLRVYFILKHELHGMHEFHEK